MPWFPINFQKATGMDTSNKLLAAAWSRGLEPCTITEGSCGLTNSFVKVMVLVLMLLLSRLACDAHSMSECCRQPARSCHLYALLCRSGSKNLGGTLTGDAAAGILTLGKRKDDEHLVQSRLQQLLQGSRNQAAGILTMGKRTEERAGDWYMDWMAQSGYIVTTPLPVLS